VEVLEHCRIKNVIMDKHVILPPNSVIGYNREDDEKRFKTITLDKKQGTWLTVIPKHRTFDRELARIIEPEFPGKEESLLDTGLFETADDEITKVIPEKK
jgi:hypothetical protein